VRVNLLVFFERTPSTKSEFYFELDNGEACFLSDEGIFLFSVLSNLARTTILSVPFVIWAFVLILTLPTVLPIAPIISWNPSFSFLVTLSFLVLPFIARKLASVGRGRKFAGRPLGELLMSSDRKYLRSRRQWSEVRTAKFSHYKVILKWHTSTFLVDRGLTLKFVATSFAELKSFLAKQLDGGLMP